MKYQKKQLKYHSIKFNYLINKYKTKEKDFNKK